MTTETQTPARLQPSARAAKVPASPIRKLSPLADVAKSRGTHVYHLNIGQPDIETPECMMKTLREIDKKVLEYSPSAGTPEFVDTLRRYYKKATGAELERGEVLATTGGSEAILFAYMACADPGDDVMVLEPFYTNYRSFASLASLNVVPVTASAANGFHIPPREAWEKALTPRTRIVTLCNPNNPTGTVYSREEVEQVAAFCRDHGLFLVSDEVYREFVYDGGKATSALELTEYKDLVIVVDSLSKRFSACGIRLGCLVTRNGDIYSAVLRMAQGRLSPPGLAQMIAVSTNGLDESYTTKVIAEYQHRRDVLFEGLTSIPGVFLQKPEGAFYCVAKLPVANAEDFAVWLLTDFSHDGATVMVSPANGFYASDLGRDEVRIAYVLNETDLRKSIELLRIALEQYPGKN